MMLDLQRIFADAGCRGWAYAEPVAGGAGVGLDPGALVTPASVMKVQVAQAAVNAIAAGELDGEARVRLAADRRTPGPVGVSLLRDDVEVSVRDLVPLMLTISDNVATDALLGLVGVPAVNNLTSRLGMADTHVVSDLATMLDDMAGEVGFASYAALVDHEPGPGEADEAELRRRLAASAALDPERGSRTTPRDCVRLLQAIWADTAGPPECCEEVRRVMAQQLTRHRLAAGFGPGTAVAAKSGGLLGVVRNEVGVVRPPGGASYAVAVFTRVPPGAGVDPRRVDAAIGAVAARVVADLGG